MDWKRCCEKGIVKRAKPKKRVIKALKQSSENKHATQVQIALTKVTASSKFSLAYDSMRDLLEAVVLMHGYKIYNHECYTAFLRDVLGDKRRARSFDSLRKIRNAANYYGKPIPESKAESLLKQAQELRLFALRILEAQIAKPR